MRYQSRIDSFCKIQCPYYASENKRTISCAGIVGSDSVGLTFDTEDGKDAYILEHCMEYPNACPLAIIKEMEIKHGK